MKALIVKEDGLIYAAEVPEEPKYCTDFGDVILICNNTFCKCDSQLKGYRTALASAKKSAVLVSDQEKASKIIINEWIRLGGNSVDGILPGIYPIPDLQWEPRTVEKFYEGKGWFWETVAILKESTPSTEQESQDVTEREIYNALKEDDDLTNDINALGYFKSEAGKFMWIKTYLAGMYQSGVTEFRISLTDKKTGLIHPLGKDGKTLDFHL